jgi:hypothetical protein
MGNVNAGEGRLAEGPDARFPVKTTKSGDKNGTAAYNGLTFWLLAFKLHS